MSSNRAQKLAQRVSELIEVGKLPEIVKILRGLEKAELEMVLMSSIGLFDETILHSASYKGNVEIVKFLLEIGAQPFLSAGNQTSTPLHR